MPTKKQSPKDTAIGCGCLSILAIILLFIIGGCASLLSPKEEGKEDKPAAPVTSSAPAPTQITTSPAPPTPTQEQAITEPPAEVAPETSAPAPTVEEAPAPPPAAEEPTPPQEPQPIAPLYQPPAEPEPAPAAAPYKNCAEARAAGDTPVYSTNPRYAPHLDGDHDGVGCERG